MKRKKHEKIERTFATATLPFERPIAELERTIREMKSHVSDSAVDLSNEIRSAEKKLDKEIHRVFENLTPWQRVQVARHPLRPYTLDYICQMMENFVEIHGDRHFADDKAIVCGFARFRGQNVCVIGHQKGRDTKENLMRSFGSAHPEGYRKAMRVMRLAEKFGVPIVCFVDTPGAYPGIGAEERGQAEAIAYNIREMSELTVPIVVAVIGEGGSGGALGVGVGDYIIILDNAYYSVISPEGCAAILWKDNSRAQDAASVLRLTGKDLMELGIVDEIVKEPLGGAHRDFYVTAERLADAIEKALKRLVKHSPRNLIDNRYDKFRQMGVFEEKTQ